MLLWGKQADDGCDGALMSQKRVGADSVVWLQVLLTHTHTEKEREREKERRTLHLILSVTLK